ncbi:hypothetical protein CUMW_012230, partial [Citrus unshiu]
MLPSVWFEEQQDILDRKDNLFTVYFPHGKYLFEEIIIIII